MQQSSETLITLASIGGGAALELFEHEFKRVLTNIADVNTNAKKPREINIKIVIKPDDDRDVGEAQVFVSSKLAATKPVKSTVYFGKKDGKLVAVENNPIQPNMFDSPEKKADMAKVVPLSQASSQTGA